MESTRITVEELLDQEGTDLESLMESCLFDLRNYPALCEHGCEVEADGHCEHGNPSFALELGYV